MADWQIFKENTEANEAGFDELFQQIWDGRVPLPEPEPKPRPKPKPARVPDPDEPKSYIARRYKVRYNRYEEFRKDSTVMFTNVHLKELKKIMRVSFKRIAKIVGVNTSTITRLYHKQTVISPGTNARLWRLDRLVRKAIAMTDYRTEKPNFKI